MSLRLQNASKVSESQVKPAEHIELQREVDKMRAELLNLRKEAKEASPKVRKEIEKEEKTLKNSISSFLLDLSEEVPLVGRFVHWLRS